MENRNEISFLREVVQNCWGKNNQKKLEKITQKIDWIKLEEVLQELSMHGFLYDYLSCGQELPKVPVDFIQRLKNRVTRTALYNGFLVQEAIGISKLLKQYQILHVFVKGPVLLSRVYGEYWKREMCDLDVLVFSKDLSLLSAALQTLGFTTAGNLGSDTPAKFSSDIRDTQLGEVAFEKRANFFTVNLDLHFSVLAHGIRNHLLNRYFPLESVGWEQETTTVLVDGFPLPCLTEESEFLYEVFHFSVHHGFAGLKWLIDIGSFIRASGETLSWEKIKQLAIYPNLRRALQLTLQVLNEWMPDSKGLQYIFTQLPRKNTPSRIEKRLYRGQIMRNPYSLRGRVGMKFVQILLPLKTIQRASLLIETFFKPASSFTVGKNASPFDVFFPLRLLKAYQKQKNESNP